MDIAPTFNYTGHGSEGSKYKAVSDLRTCDIAKLIKKEIKAKYPNYKISVSTETFSGGSEINIKINSFDKPINNQAFKYYSKNKLFNKPFNTWLREDNQNHDLYMTATNNQLNGNISQYTPEADNLLKDLEKIANQYNFDDSDGMIDYFHTNYYLHVGFDYQYEKLDLNA